MHIPPGYASFIPSAIRAAVDLPVVGVGRFKDPLQAERALAEGTCDLVGVVRGQIADADFAAKARAGATDDIRLCLSCNQECVGRMGLNRWLGCIENPRHRPRARVAAVGHGERRRPAAVGDGRRRRPGRPAGRHRRGPQRPPRDGARARRRGRRPGAPGRVGAQPGRVRRPRAQPAGRVPAARRDRSSSASTATVDAGPGVAGADRVIVATGADAARPWWAPARRRRGRRRAATCSTASAHPAGRVVVIDEIGFHHATSVAELLADRGCTVEVVTPGMVVGQDLGITLDMENWWMRAGAKGIVQSTDLVPMGVEGHGAQPAAPPHRADAGTARPTGSCWPCRPPRPRGSTSS